MCSFHIFQCENCIPKPVKLWPEQKGSRVRSFESIYAKLKKKIDLRISSCALEVEIKAMIYNAARVRRLFKKIQVDACKTKKDGSAHAQLRQAKIYNPARVRRLPYLQNFKSIHAKLKKIDLHMCSYTH